MRRVSRYVHQLLRNRRPRAFVPTDDEAAAIRAGIVLRTAHPETATPDADFVARLRGRLADEISRLDESEPLETPQRQPSGSRRRGVLLGAVAASAALAVVADRATEVVTGAPRGTSSLPTGATTPNASSGTLSPDSGMWSRVMSVADLAEGQVSSFDTGAVVGFVMRTAGEVSALSGMCTHQGCRLRLNRPAGQLDCPCHQTSFALDGRVARYQLAISPARLPAIQVREKAGQVEVFVPKSE